uniref:Asporin n=1 Tax=Laticauda laticaudata TaxID=8630 RepID=A0A8C5RJ51_LATLA
MKEYILLLLVALSCAKPFQKPSYFTFKNIMLMDMEDLDDDDDDDDVDDDDKDDNSLFPTRVPLIPVDIFPVCPFGCQCYLRVVHCSDLGLTSVPRNIPLDTRMIDLQNNKIKEIKENDFKGLSSLYCIIFINLLHNSGGWGRLFCEPHQNHREMGSEQTE